MTFSDDSASASPILMTIEPDPTPDERDAIVAALAIVMWAQSHEPTVEAKTSRWSCAGRQSVHRSRATFYESLALDRLDSRGTRTANRRIEAKTSE